ncbi:MAG: universal stress protein [Thermodesulfobacteriota bacterium]
MKVNKVLVPVDFSQNAKRIVQEGFDIADKFGAEVHILFVAQVFQDYSEFFVPHMPVIQFEEDLLSRAREKMDEFIKENFDNCSSCKTEILTGDVAETILAYAEEKEVDLIVMGTHGYKGLEKILFGSVAEKVVKTAHCPVLTINPYK